MVDEDKPGLMDKKIKLEKNIGNKKVDNFNWISLLKLKLNKLKGVVGGVSLIISVIVGSGIFVAPTVSLLIIK
jgi:hypothetical protein